MEERGVVIYEDHFFRLFGIFCLCLFAFCLLGNRNHCNAGLWGSKRRRVGIFLRHLRWAYCYAAQ